MAETKQFRNLTEYHNGNSAENNIKLSDVAPFQHENLATNTNKLGKMNMAQTFCEPVAVCNSNSPADGAYTATCVNYPDFAVSYDDSHGTSHYLYGMKVRVIFTYGITYGSVSSGTYPTLSINGSGALPLLAQGKTMAQGAIVAGQSVEFTIIPYGNSIAFDADSNVRENTTDYTIYTDGNGRTNVVAANNLQSVTSDAVFKSAVAEISHIAITTYKAGNSVFSKIGKVVYLQSTGDWQSLPPQQDILLFNIPTPFRPKDSVYLREQSYLNIRLLITTDGNVYAYSYDTYPNIVNGAYLGSWLAAN